MTKPFIVANVREIMDLLDRNEISYSRMVEMLNDKAAEFYKQEVAKEREKSKKLYEALAGALSIIEMSSRGVDMPKYTSCVGYINGKQSLTEYEKL